MSEWQNTKLFFFVLQQDFDFHFLKKKHKQKSTKHDDDDKRRVLSDKSSKKKTNPETRRRGKFSSFSFQIFSFPKKRKNEKLFPCPGKIKMRRVSHSLLSTEADWGGSTKNYLEVSPETTIVISRECLNFSLPLTLSSSFLFTSPEYILSLLNVKMWTENCSLLLSLQVHFHTKLILFVTQRRKTFFFSHFPHFIGRRKWLNYRLRSQAWLSQSSFSLEQMDRWDFCQFRVASPAASTMEEERWGPCEVNRLWEIFVLYYCRHSTSSPRPEEGEHLRLKRMGKFTGKFNYTKEIFSFLSFFCYRSSCFAPSFAVFVAALRRER